MQLRDRAIRDLRFRIAAVHFAGCWLLVAISLCFLLGTVAVVGKVLGAELSLYRAALVLLALSLIGVAVYVWRKLPTDTALCAMLDASNAHGGLLLASLEGPLGDWGDRITYVRLPVVRGSLAKPAGLFCLAFVYLAAGMLIPKYEHPHAARPFQLDEAVAQVEEQIALLEEESLITKEASDRLAAQVDSLEEEAKGESPAETLEALDHLKNTVAGLGEEAGKDLISKAEAAHRLDQLAAGLQDLAPKVSSASLAGAMKEMAELADMYQADLGAMLRPSGDSPVDPAQLEALRKALLLSRGEMKRLMEKLQKMALVDAEAVRQAAKAGDIDPASMGEALKAFLKEAGKGKEGEAVLLLQGDLAMMCGVAEGPGHIALRWTDGTSEEGAEFKPDVLPPGSMSDMKDSERIGFAFGSPTDQDISRKPITYDALRGAAAGQGGTVTQQVLPRHRGAVQRYFERKKTEQDEP